MSDTNSLLELLVRQSVKRGDFLLASGKRSDLYVDARMTTMHPEGLLLVGALGLEAISAAGWAADSIGGLTLGADPVAYAVAYASARSRRALRAFTVRKEAKTHGAGKRIEGPFVAGDRVVVVEDVITTGASALTAVEVVRAHGGIVLGVLAVVDRQEGGRETIEAAGVPVKALATRGALLARVAGA